MQLDAIQFFPKAHELESVSIQSLPASLKIIGIGTDAIVVQGVHEYRYVYKVYHPEAAHKQSQEREVYQRLGWHPHFGVCLSAQSNWLMLRYEPGPTLYQCLNLGITIPAQVVEDVFLARSYARSRGLNPRDIHPHNVILQGGRAKIIDVAEFLRSGCDGRWSHSVKYYEAMYSWFRGRRIPHGVLQFLRDLYKAKEKVGKILGS